MRKTVWSRHEELLALGVLGRTSGIVERIEMLLRRGRDFSPRASRMRVAAIAIALLACVVAGSLAPRWIAFAQQPPPPAAGAPHRLAQAQAPAPAPAPSPARPPQPAPKQAQEKSGPGWLDEIEAAGFRDLNVDRLIGMKMAGVTGEYIRETRAAGFQLTADQLVSFRIHGVTADFVNELKKMGFTNLSADDLVAFRIHGADPAFIQQVRALGYPNVTAQEIISLRVTGVTLDFIREAQKHFKDLTIDQLVQLNMLGILKPSRTV